MIANLESEIKNCKRNGIDPEKETGMTLAQIKQLSDKVAEERRKKMEGLGLIKCRAS